MKGLAVSFIVGILGLSIVGFGQLSGSESNYNNNWYGNFWNNNNNWYNNDWHKNFWGYFDINKYTGFLNSGGSDDDDDDDDDDDNDDGDDHLVESTIDDARVSFTVVPRPIHTQNEDYFQNVVSECIFSSEDNFDPLCVKCKIFDMMGNLIGEGKVFDPDDEYMSPDQIPIPISSVDPDAPVPSNVEVSNVVQELSAVEISVCAPDGKGEGCTPGFWKQSQHFDSWTAPYTPETLFDSVFDFPAGLEIKVDNMPKDLEDATLLDALRAQGGGVNALARHGVAGLLNAASPANYQFTVQEVIDMVNDALNSGDPTEIESTKNKLAIANEQGCPFDKDECDEDQHKEDHKTYRDDFESDYNKNKKYYQKVDYAHHLESFQNYFENNKDHFDKEDFKQGTDYYRNFLDTNKNKFDRTAYDRYDKEYKNYMNEYSTHDDETECDDDTPPPEKECKGISLLKLEYKGTYSGVTIKVYKGSTLYTTFSSVASGADITIPIPANGKLNESLVFKIYKGTSLKDEIKIDATCSKIKNVGDYYTGKNGYKLKIKMLEKIMGW